MNSIDLRVNGCRASLTVSMWLICSSISLNDHNHHKKTTPMCCLFNDIVFLYQKTLFLMLFTNAYIKQFLCGILCHTTVCPTFMFALYSQHKQCNPINQRQSDFLPEMSTFWEHLKIGPQAFDHLSMNFILAYLCNKS